eukprot:9385100-Pyramimonas_sp.AAC.1
MPGGCFPWLQASAPTLGSAPRATSAVTWQCAENPRGYEDDRWVDSWGSDSEAAEAACQDGAK